VARDYVRQVRDGQDPLIEIKAAQDVEIEKYNKGLADDQLTVKAMCEWARPDLITPAQRGKGRVVGVISRVLVKESKESVLQKPTGISYAIPVKYVHNLIEGKGQPD
jgi:hypothetical protein